MPHCSLMSMSTPLFLFQNWSSHVLNIQWTKFERKSIVTFISGELPFALLPFLWKVTFNNFTGLLDNGKRHKTHDKIFMRRLPASFPVEGGFVKWCQQWPSPILSISLRTSRQHKLLTFSYCITSNVINDHLLYYNKYFMAAQKTHHNGIDNITVVVFQSFYSLRNNSE